MTYQKVIFLTLILLNYSYANTYYMGTQSTFIVGSFVCDTSHVVITITINSDTTLINFIGFSANPDYSCGTGQYIYSKLSLVGIQSFSGILAKNTSGPLCYGFQNPSTVSGTYVTYTLDVDCVTYPAPPIVNVICSPDNNTPFIISAIFNGIFGIAIIIIAFCLNRECIRRHNLTKNIIGSTIEPERINL